MVNHLTKCMFIYSTLKTTEGRPFVAIIGPRGVGKTIILRQMRTRCENGLYILADTLSVQSALFNPLSFEYMKGALYPFLIEDIP